MTHPRDMDYATGLKFGDVIEISGSAGRIKGCRIMLAKRPAEWAEYHQLWYVWGYRWIKSTGKFSSNCLLFNFTHAVPYETPNMHHWNDDGTDKILAGV